MTLQQIIYFIEIAHTQHFTQAAQNLFVSQSALSYSIQALERELGVPLFIRRKSERKVEMTAYGKKFLPYCEMALDTEPIARQELFMYLSKSNSLAEREKLSLYDIQDQQIIGYYKNSNLYDWITEMFQESGLKPNMTSSYQEWASHMVYVSLDQGIAILPNLPYDSSTISKVKIDHPKSKRYIYILSPQDGRLTSAAEHIRNYCVQWAKENQDKVY